jgi:hypothetical protein
MWGEGLRALRDCLQLGEVLGQPLHDVLPLPIDPLPSHLHHRFRRIVGNSGVLWVIGVTWAGVQVSCHVPAPPFQVHRGKVRENNCCYWVAICTILGSPLNVT